jgi:PKD repeat protein
LPYSNTVDTTAATTEVGEPTPSCATFFNPTGTVWYAFTPPVSETVSTNIQAFFGSTVVAAYSGSSLSNLSELGSACFGGTLSVHLNGGTTYYFQAAGLFGGRGSLTFNLFVTPPPSASFFFSPSDPSIFDTVQFTNNSTDPGELGFQPATWDFGDGTSVTTATNPVSHQYAKDGDYTVKLTVTTVDGRTASTSQVVSVKTHDVSIAKFLVPTAASVGQTRTITVGISNSRYPETVQVQLFKSTTIGFSSDPIGTQTQFVPVLAGGRTIAFSINYTFTSDDAALGKVSFEAVATIIGARDALPADNTAISMPTRITP